MMTTRLSWKTVLCAAALLVAAAPVAAWQTAPIPEETDGEAGDDVGLREDGRARMTVPVSISGSGPYQFLVDTGAERTIISAELAARLSLAAGASTRMHSMSGVGNVATVVIPHLQVSKKEVNDIHAPALRAAHIGAAGMLGIDSLQAQRILFDFKNQKMTLVPSRTPQPRREPDEIVVTAKTRLGRLVLVDAKIQGEKIMVVLDTGAEVSIGNEALRRKLITKKKLGETAPLELISITGAVVMADYTQAREIQLGGVTIQNMPIAFADLHPFEQLGLKDRPALLLGMDALRLFDRVSVDFATRKVRFLSPAFENRRHGMALQERLSRLSGS